MLERIRSKLSYANVMATIAVFVVMTGITVAIASVPRKSVGPKQLKNGAVRSKQLKNGAVGSKKIRKNAVNASKIRKGAVGRSELANGAVGRGKISNRAVITKKLADGAVTRVKVADSAIPFLGTLRTGQELRGMFDLGGDVTDIRDGQTFQFPLTNPPSGPAANVIDASVPSPAFTSNCQGLSGGNQQTPLAAPGQLCVYITFPSANFSSLTIEPGALTRLGFGLLADFSAAVPGNQVVGQWAVTAP